MNCMAMSGSETQPRLLTGDDDDDDELASTPIRLNNITPIVPSSPAPAQPSAQPSTGQLKPLPDAKRAKSCDPSLLSSPRGLKVKVDAEESDGACCPICYEPWASSGSHRLSSLKCGHLFGLACLERMFALKQDRCPLCQLPARKADIRPIFAPKSLTTSDQTEVDGLKSQLEALQKSERQAQLERDEALAKFKTSRAELAKAQSELVASRQQCLALQESTSNSTLQTDLPAESPSPAATCNFKLVRKVILPNGGNRCLAYDASSQQLLVSSHSTHATPFYPNGSHGLSKIDVERPEDAQYIQMHTNTVRDVRPSPNEDGLLITAALDQQLKIASSTTNSVITGLRLNQACWTCCWHRQQPVYIFAGLTNHRVQVFDIRNTSEHLMELSTPARDPIVALHHVDVLAGNGKRLSGLLTASLKGVGFWHLPSELTLADDCRHQPLPLLDGSVTSLAANSARDGFLASYRPGGQAAKVTRHVHFGLGVADVGNDATCVVQRQLLGGPHQKTLSRSALVETNNGMVVCASNEANVSALLWDIKTGTRLQELKRQRSQLGYLDFTSWKTQDRQLLCGLVDGKVDVFSQPIA
eukprot:TRINITY_DN10791_c0_g1_i1.p1 TRINITY_DN10791_c0_g1~~TRINITY_DN10791_c0_g1_i1.p1  ORF type:complete len:586 (+),score=113.86 TRINITY_DN10791_c0_g1_i1:77-1834(+)